MVKISPSLLAIKKNMFKIVSKIKADYLHVDVMDGKFVESTTDFNNPEYVRKIKESSDVPLDIHLMVKEPLKRVKEFIEFGEFFTVHFSACDKKELEDVINFVKSKGKKVGIVLNPDIPLENILEFLPRLDMVLIMSVYPGKCGQSFIPEVLYKVRKLKELRGKNNYVIEIDGGIKIDNAQLSKDAGVDILVSGSGIFGKENFNEAIKLLSS